MRGLVVGCQNVGVGYVRNQNAESKPIKTVDELRAVIGLVTRKKGDELIAHFEAMLRGRSLASLEPAPDPFKQEIAQAQSDLQYDGEKGGWWISFHPQTHVGVRWATPEELERLIDARSVRIYEEFPGHQKGTFRMGWGIANDLYGETWALTKSGLFCFWKEFQENGFAAERTGYRGGEDARRPIPAGEWVEYGWAIREMVDFFLFLSRFVEEYGPGEGVHINLKVGPLVGRKLVSLNRDIMLGYGAPDPCRAPYFSFEQTFEAETLRASWESVCAEALKQLVELFPNHRISIETLLKTVERYKTRHF